MNETQKWDVKLLGKLKNDGIMRFVNDNTTIRYSIDVKSSPPYSLPENAIDYLTSFSDDLNNFGYIDDLNLDENARIDYLHEYLDAHYIMFKIKSKYNSDDFKSFYNAYDIELVRKENYGDNTFNSIPFIQTFSESTPEMLNKLFNNEFVGKNFAISKETEDCPSFIIIGEYNHNGGKIVNGSNKLGKPIAFGPIKDIQFSEEYGFKFITEPESTYYIELDIDDLGEFYLSKEKVMFITWEKDKEITDLLESSGKKISPTSANKQKIEDINEAEFLNTFKEVALSRELSYKPSNLINFHTAMKTQSFVILAGMSGTGKSKIVECYHEAINKFANKPNKNNSSIRRSKLLFVPVRPFWQDDSDILGYLDSAQGIYRPGDSGLVDFIKEASEPENKDECYIVCLDEMNLAKVEHYFSQFLSILERDIKDREINLYNEKLNGRIYNQNDYPAKLKLSENIFFVGTVNIDESTHQFSDKVLDRANIITLDLSSFEEIRNNISNYPKPKQKEQEPNNTISEPLRTYVKLKGMKRSHKNDVLTLPEVNLLWEINLQMQKVNNQLGVGYRIVKQIENYIANLPISDELSRAEGLDLQITQRILTKLRGSQGQLSSIIGKFENGEYTEGELFTLFNTNSALSNFTTAKAKLINIAKELSEYGHTI